MNNSFVNTQILVVGGSSGIGNAVARRLIDGGASVTIWSRSKPEELISRGAQWSAVDVTDDFDTAELSVPDPLDGVVYAPGSINLASFRRLEPGTFLDDYQVNVVGAVRVLKGTIAALSAAPGASVVLYGTVATALGMPFHASVAAAKSGVVGLAKSLAAEYASKNVRFNVVSPSLTDTPMASALLSTEKKRAASAERHPIQRIGTVDDIASATLFLLDPSNSWITGQVIGVDGGLSSLSRG